MKTVRALIVLLGPVMVWYSCVNHDLRRTEGPGEISLRWNRSHPGELSGDVVKGLQWTFSFLGAELPEGSSSHSFRWIARDMLLVDITRLGFSAQGEKQVIALLGAMKESEEYRINGAIDVGRFVMLAFNSTWHYYAITGAAETLDQYRQSYRFSASRGAVISSCVAAGHREIEVSQERLPGNVSFIAAEGTGSLVDETFEVAEFETMDVMKNGQLRFALYDRYGSLKTGASPALTSAGKPAKCLWCHETNVQSLNLMSDVPGYYTRPELQSILEATGDAIAAYRATLHSDIDFRQAQDHSLSELLYVSFMEPSAARLAQEWNVPLEEVRELLSALPTHQNPEYPALEKQLYRREDVESFAPYEAMAVPSDARETSAFEPRVVSP